MVLGRDKPIFGPDPPFYEKNNFIQICYNIVTMTFLSKHNCMVSRVTRCGASDETKINDLEIRFQGQMFEFYVQKPPKPHLLTFSILPD